MSFLYPVFNWFSTNKYAGWIAGFLLLLFLGKIRDNHLETKHRRDEREKAEDEVRKQQQAIEKAAVEHTKEIRKEASNEADKALAARDSVGPNNDYDSMSDEEFYLTFGYHKTPDQFS